MPGYAGSSWYFLRYMDPHNDTAFCDRKVSDYWGQVDLYIGGTEHAVGHLLYSRMWTKVLYDLGHIGFDEPYKKLVNQYSYVFLLLYKIKKSEIGSYSAVSNSPVFAAGSPSPIQYYIRRNPQIPTAATSYLALVASTNRRRGSTTYSNYYSQTPYSSWNSYANAAAPVQQFISTITINLKQRI